MIKRQIAFLFEEPRFCIDVFCTIAEPVRYYNRDTESGAWYSSTPDWNENGSLIREDLIFEVISDGVVCALDGNGNFEGKKLFVPFCQFRQSLVQSVHTQYPHLQDQEALREKLLSLPDARETIDMAGTGKTGSLPPMLRTFLLSFFSENQYLSAYKLS